MNTPLVFVHDFGDSVRCKLTIANERPEPGQMLAPLITWTGIPQDKHFGDYHRWTLYILQTLSNHWSGEIIYALETPNNTEFWLFEPGESPRLVRTLTPAGS